MSDENLEKRLSQKVFEALKMAVEQEAIPTAEALSKALDLSMTRKTGGATFVERRDLPEGYDVVLAQLEKLKSV